MRRNAVITEATSDQTTINTRTARLAWSASVVSKHGQQPHARGAGFLARSAISLDNNTCREDRQREPRKVEVSDSVRTPIASVVNKPENGCVWLHKDPHARGAGLLARSAISLENKTCWQETQWRRLPLKRPTAEISLRSIALAILMLLWMTARTESRSDAITPTIAT